MRLEILTSNQSFVGSAYSTIRQGFQGGEADEEGYMPLLIQ